MRSIPVVDLSQFKSGDEAQERAFVSALGTAFREVGFVSVINHGIDHTMVKEFYDAAYSFFKLPKDVKQKYEIPGAAGQRGYTSFGKEHARQSKVADLKEFFQIGQEINSGDYTSADLPSDVKVDEVPAFGSVGRDLYRAFEATGALLLKAIARYLDLEDGYFHERIQHGSSILRAIHYPPITEEPASAIRAEQHEDINLITLLVGASAGGLQVMNKDGEWVDVQTDDSEIVVNVGDMLQRLTNDYLKSTTHRVVNPPRELWHTPRLSIPFFLHPRAEMDLTSLPNTITAGNPSRYEPITAGEYLDERLREIGLKK